MNFGFTETQEAFRHRVRDFVDRELVPEAEERSKLEFIPSGLIKKAAEAGILGVNLPEQYGGYPADWISVGIAFEEVAKVDTYLTNPMSMAQGACMALRAGTEELRREWLPAVVKGDKLPCIALTEPNCGSDAAAIRTRAVRDGDHYLISGEKTCISRAMHTDVALLWAKTDPQAGARGVTLFLLPLDLPGITMHRLPHAGFKPQSACAVTLDDVRIPARNRVGEEGQGFYVVMGAFDVYRSFVALVSLAKAQVCLESTIEWAKRQSASGRAITKNQGVSFMFAEAATRLDAARLLAYRPLWLRDQGLPHTKESSMCKWFGAEVATQVIRDLMLIAGPERYTEETPLLRHLMDTLGSEIFEGAPQIQKRIIARELLGKESV